MLTYLLSKYYIPNSILIGLAFEKNSVHRWISITPYYSRRSYVIPFIVKFISKWQEIFSTISQLQLNNELTQNFRFVLISLSYVIFCFLFIFIIIIFFIFLFLFNPTMIIYLSIKLWQNVCFSLLFLSF